MSRPAVGERPANTNADTNADTSSDCDDTTLWWTALEDWPANTNANTDANTSVCEPEPPAELIAFWDAEDRRIEELFGAMFADTEANIEADTASSVQQQPNTASSVQQQPNTFAAVAGRRLVFRRPTAGQALAVLCCMPFVQASNIREESAETNFSDYLFTAMLAFTIGFFFLCSGIIGAFVGHMSSRGTASITAPALQHSPCTADAGTQTHFATADAKMQTQVATTEVEIQTVAPQRSANDVATQSQCTYTALRGTQAIPQATPRFLPLGDAATGVWRMGARAVGR